MSEAQNKELVEQLFRELAVGNSQPFWERVSDDVEWTVIGSNSWSKTYVGKRAVLDELFVPLRKTLARPGRTIAQRLLADGDHVVVEARGDNLTKRGEPYQNRYCFVIRMQEGRVRAFTEYADTELVTRLLGERPELGVGSAQQP